MREYNFLVYYQVHINWLILMITFVWMPLIILRFRFYSSV